MLRGFSWRSVSASTPRFLYFFRVHKWKWAAKGMTVMWTRNVCRAVLTVEVIDVTPRPGFTHSTHCFRIWVFLFFLYIYIRSSSLRVSLFTQRCLTLEAPAANTTVSQTELVQWINIRIYDIILTSFLHHSLLLLLHVPVVLFFLCSLNCVRWITQVTEVEDGGGTVVRWNGTVGVLSISEP